MSEPDEVAGVFEAIDAEGSSHKPVDDTQVSDKAKAEGAEDQGAETKKTEKKETQETGTTDEGETQQTETSDESKDAHSKDASETEGEQKPEDKKPEAKTEQEFSDWQKTLPPAPAEFAGKKPEFNEQGQITNMTPQEYLDYTVGMAEQAVERKSYTNFVEAKALDVAEQILPDIKTNPNVRKMVENTRIASILSGTPIDTVQAALSVRDLLGISPEKIQAAKTEGANSTKASIKIQKNAALETGSTQKGDSEGDKIKNLQKRVAKGDDNAFAELLGIWEKDGKL